MLPKKYRLPSYKIPQVLQQGKRLCGQGIIVVFQSSQKQCSRFAFIVGTSVHKHAVQRNRVKRMLRESIHHFVPLFHSSRDVVIMGGRRLVDLSQVEVEKRLRSLL